MFYRVVFTEAEFKAVKRAVGETKDIYLDCAEDDSHYIFLGKLYGAEDSLLKVKVMETCEP